MENVKNFSLLKSPHQARTLRRAVAAAVLLAIGACGGGGGGSERSAGDLGGTGPQAAALAVVVPTQTEAARFLTQATFGPTSAEIQRLSGMSYAQWIEEQFGKPQTLHRLYMNQAAADLASVGQQLSRTNFFDSYWSQAIGGEDQLRQRAAFALSEIMVISFTDATLSNQPRGVSSYYDMLGRERVRQLPQAARGRVAASDDGHLPDLARQPEGRRRDRPRARPQLRARDHAAVHDRRVDAERRRHLRSSIRTASRRPPTPAPTSPACAGLHRLQLVRRPEHSATAPTRRYFGNDAEPRARLAADAGLQRVRAEHRVPFGQRRRPSSA